MCLLQFRAHFLQRFLQITSDVILVSGNIDGKIKFYPTALLNVLLQLFYSLQVFWFEIFLCPTLVQSHLISSSSAITKLENIKVWN